MERWPLKNKYKGKWKEFLKKLIGKGKECVAQWDAVAKNIAWNTGTADKDAWGLWPANEWNWNMITRFYILNQY